MSQVLKVFLLSLTVDWDVIKIEYEKFVDKRFGTRGMTLIKVLGALVKPKGVTNHS